MAIGSILLFLLVGAIAGWLAGLLMRGRGFGLLANILIGILGGLVGGLLFDSMGWDVGGGILGAVFVAFVGAAILVFITGLFGRVARA